MYALTVALRHLRTRSISWVAVALIASIVLMYLLIISVLEGSKQHWMDKLQSILAHTTVNVGDYAGGIERPEIWADEIAKVDPQIRGVTIGLESPAMVLFDSARTIGSLRGIDLERELKYGRLKEIIRPGGLHEFGFHDQGGKKSPGCIVGGAWRKTYNLSLGGRVTFIFTGEDEDQIPRTVAFTIIGFFEGNNPYLEMAAYVDRKFLAEKLQVPNMAKTLFVWMNDPNRPDLGAVSGKIKLKLQELIKRDVPGSADNAKLVRVETWQEKDNEFYHAITSENRLMRIIMGVFLALIAFIIFLIFGRLVAEKIRDIGALRAMGATPYGILGCFLVQACFIGCLGLLSGLIASYFFITHINEIVNFIAVTFKIVLFPGDLFGPNRVLTLTLPMDIVLISALTFIAALAGAFLPAWRAAKLNPVECLRHE